MQILEIVEATQWKQRVLALTRSWVRYTNSSIKFSL